VVPNSISLILYDPAKSCYYVLIMKDMRKSRADLPITVYTHVSLSDEQSGRPPDTKQLLKFRVFVTDKPGALPACPPLIAERREKIGFFPYGRSLDSGRVSGHTE